VSGGIPDDLGAHEHIAGRVAQQVSTRHRIDNELYREGQNTFETTGLFDIATLIGVCYRRLRFLNIFAKRTTT